MNKYLKILLVIFVCVFFFFTTNCFAVNIDMNLSSNLVDSNTTSTSNDIVSEENTTNDNNSVSNTDLNTESNSNTVSNSEDTASNRISGTADALQSLPEAELGLTNILNILLIAVGVVLILLSIAIFIKLSH